MKGLDLSHALQKGDYKAFETLFNSYVTELCVFCYQYVNDETAAEDLVQDFFIKLWQDRTLLEIKVSFRAYAYKAIYLRSLNYLRDQKRRGINEPLEAYSESLVSNELDFFQLEEQSKLQVELNEAIAALPTQCRRIFELVYFDQLKYEEVAKQLNLSVNTIKVQMSKAYKLLRKKFGDATGLITVLLFLIYLQN